MGNVSKDCVGKEKKREISPGNKIKKKKKKKKKNNPSHREGGKGRASGLDSYKKGDLWKGGMPGRGRTSRQNRLERPRWWAGQGKTAFQREGRGKLLYYRDFEGNMEEEVGGILGSSAIVLHHPHLLSPVTSESGNSRSGSPQGVEHQKKAL